MCWGMGRLVPCPRRPMAFLLSTAAAFLSLMRGFSIADPYSVLPDVYNSVMRLSLVPRGRVGDFGPYSPRALSFLASPVREKEGRRGEERRGEGRGEDVSHGPLD